MIKITISDPLKPEASGWDEAVRLRESARIEIAKHCGEHTIDLVLAGLASKPE